MTNVIIQPDQVRVIVGPNGPVGPQQPLSANAADFQPDGTAAAGNVGKAADSGHVHPTDTKLQGRALAFAVALGG